MSVVAIRAIELPSGEEIPVLGQGMWGWAQDARLNHPSDTVSTGDNGRDR